MEMNTKQEEQKLLLLIMILRPRAKVIAANENHRKRAFLKSYISYDTALGKSQQNFVAN